MSIVATCPACARTQSVATDGQSRRISPQQRCDHCHASMSGSRVRAADAATGADAEAPHREVAETLDGLLTEMLRRCDWSLIPFKTKLAIALEVADAET